MQASDLDTWHEPCSRTRQLAVRSESLSPSKSNQQRERMNKHDSHKHRYNHPNDSNPLLNGTDPSRNTDLQHQQLSLHDVRWSVKDLSQQHDQKLAKHVVVHVCASMHHERLEERSSIVRVVSRTSRALESQRPVYLLWVECGRGTDFSRDQNTYRCRPHLRHLEYISERLVHLYSRTHNERMITRINIRVDVSC